MDFGSMSTWVFLIVVFILLDIFVVAFIIWKRKQVRRFAKVELTYIKSHWIRIIDSFSHNPAVAVLDADKVLDYALSRKGFVGSLGEKLKKAGPLFSNIDGVWQAHKLRNRLAHELHSVNSAEAKSALGQFKRALNDLGADL